MAAFLFSRLLGAAVTLLFVSALVFGLQELIPGDPARVLAGEDQDPSVIAYLHERLHLDRALPVRYGYWLGALAHGDLGVSVRSQEPVVRLIAEKLPVTLELGLLAMAVALLIGIPSGVLAATLSGTRGGMSMITREARLLKTLVTSLALCGLSTPNFWLGILMILVFSVHLGWFPASGYVSPLVDWHANLAAMAMPAFVLGNALAAVLMRHTASALVAALDQDYVRTARAKGLAETRVVLVHAARNAAAPLITLGALELGGLLSGAVLTEQVFTIPGFGKLVVDAVFNRDFAVVEGVVLVTASTYVLLNLAADLAYFLVNPRLRA